MTSPSGLSRAGLLLCRAADINEHAWAREDPWGHTLFHPTSSPTAISLRWHPQSLAENQLKLSEENGVVPGGRERGKMNVSFWIRMTVILCGLVFVSFMSESNKRCCTVAVLRTELHCYFSPGDLYLRCGRGLLSCCLRCGWPTSE